MEVFEEKSRIERQASSASSQIRRNSKAKYILTMAGIILFTMAVLVIIHFTREYSFWKNVNSHSQPKISTPQKLEKRTCEVPFCNTKECVLIASAMLDSMNPDVDPCSDFYSYACGGYPKVKSVPYASDFLSPAREAEQELFIDIRKVMEKSPSETEGSAMTKMRKFYDTCMNATRRDEVENRTLSFWFSDLKLAPLNYTFGDPFDFEPPVQWTELVSNLEQYQIHTLFKPHFVAAENIAPEKLEVDCLVPSLNPEAYLNTTDDELAFQLVMYKESMNAALDLLHMERATRRQFVEDVMNIDMEIAKSILLQNPATNSHFTEEQKQLLRGIWQPVVGNAVETMEIVSTCKYDVQTIFSVLSEAPNKSVVRYVMWRMMMQMMQYMGTEFRDLHIHYMTKLPVADYAYESKWKECIDIARTDLAFIALRGLLDNGYFKKETLDVVNAEFTEIKTSLTQMTEALLEHIDDSTFCKNTLDKLRNMKVSTGYIENINDNNILDSLYNGLDISEDHFTNILEIKRFKARRKFLRLWYQNNDDVTNKISLERTPLGISSSYDYTTNTIYVDLGLLRPPVFVHSTEVPEFLTYAFSSVLARELGHAFDITGSHYDADGHYREQTYWPSMIEEKYDGFSTCLLNQAASLNRDKNMNVNDTRVLNNIMADMTGFALPFQGLKSHLKDHMEEKPLPGIQLTKKQTFFVQTAQLFCEIRSKPSSDPRYEFLLSPKARVNLVILNLEDFGTIFNCPAHSDMIKEKQCDQFRMPREEDHS